MRLLTAALTVLTLSSIAAPAGADEPCTAAPATWGRPATTTDRQEEGSPVARAREMLARAKLLDEAATSDEKTAVEIAARLPALRATAKTARERADRAAGDDREILVARAEDLEADVAVSEAETTAKRRSAAENRRTARELRTRAIRLVREAPTEAITNACDPPFRFTADGRKLYRVECLK